MIVCMALIMPQSYCIDPAIRIEIIRLVEETVIRAVDTASVDCKMID